MSDKIELVKGRRYRVTKEGAHLSGWKPSGPWCQSGASVELFPDDIVEYLGMSYSGGSDGIHIHKFKLVDREHPNAPYCFEFRPMRDPNNWWDSNPDPEFLMPERTPA